jgi:hypothetical protein
MPAHIASSPGTSPTPPTTTRSKISVPVLYLLGHDHAAGRHVGRLRRAHAAVAAALAQYRAPAGTPEARVYVRRFRPFDRNLHLMVISSFLGLATHGHDPEVLLRHLGQACLAARGFEWARGFEAAGMDPPLLRRAHLHLFRPAPLRDMAAPEHRKSGKTWLAVHRRTGEHVAQPAATGASSSAP